LSDHDLTTEERDAIVASRSPNPAAKAASLARARNQEAEEIDRVQEAYDRANAERAERRSNQP
jgi:hypothetical protein